MKMTISALRLAAIGFALAGAPALPLASSAWAQGAASMGGVGQSETITVRARVKSVDQKTREVVLIGPEGNALTVVAGPDVQNLGQVKRGNMVVVRYRTSAVFVLAAPGTQLPADSLTVAGARAAAGQEPGAAAAARLVITGLVVGVDPVHHTISLVDPKGGSVRTLDVTDPQRQAQLGSIKVGDTITAVFSRAVAVAVEPAH